MTKTTPDTINAILSRTLRGETQSSIADALGIHRQTVKKVMLSEKSS